ncbi:MAG: 23S rRNA (pseudouridine(1915)-N(3))-methyltransferase RlmH [Alphaproteobacteria bacterium]|nr:23S rRNA (pseudouridine(1915)-N(3))-methyltransferase RlmH [Alphaproteobacteria bacterium]MCK5556182.1 23S rRNA (pseudouridine(1915)-N(3))-methyltransferase RlmH [Alphaproteobacteria bacterium]
MKIRIIAVGRQKASPEKDICKEYLKRIRQNISITEINAPKGSTSAQEAPLILKKLIKPSFIVALDERGETLTSSNFAEKIGIWQNQAPNNEITFLIGGADGFDNKIRKKANFLMSFGKQTWSHMMVRVMLLEQIYRAQQILAGHPYHRQ